MDCGFALRNYVRYRSKAKDEYSIHSPFIFDLFTKGLQKRSDNSQYKFVDAFAKEQAKAYSHDMGRACGYPLRLYRRELLFLCRLSSYFKPKNVLIVGNDAGICAAYLSKTLPESNIVNYLHNKTACEFLIKSFNDKGFSNVSFFCDNGNELLKTVLESMGQVDFVFLNRDCENQTPIKLMEEILPFCSENGAVTFGNIHCDREMRELWTQSIAEERFKVCADFFFCGVAFLTQNPLRKQCYVLKRK